MARFRLFEQAPQFCDATGTPYASGTLTFSDTGTTTPKAVYTDPSAGSSLGSTLTLAADGRYNGDYWLEGTYRVVLKDANGVTIWTRDNVRDVVTGGTVALDPAAGADGAFYRTDGVTAYWDPDVRELPDPTGSDGYFVVASGSGYSLQAPAAEAVADSAVSATSSGYVWKDGVLIQWGSDTAPTASSTLITTKAITFGVAFDSAPYFIGVTPAVAGVTNNSPADPPSGYYTSPSASGFTAGFFCGSENNAGTISITSTVPFTWMAIGPKAVAP